MKNIYSIVGSTYCNYVLMGCSLSELRWSADWGYCPSAVCAILSAFQYRQGRTQCLGTVKTGTPSWSAQKLL